MTKNSVKTIILPLISEGETSETYIGTVKAATPILIPIITCPIILILNVEETAINKGSITLKPLQMDSVATPLLIPIITCPIILILNVGETAINKGPITLEPLQMDSVRVLPKTSHIYDPILAPIAEDNTEATTRVSSTD
ncbi:hypothetical protein FCV25MIE_22640 [Fagus crenata]